MAGDKDKKKKKKAKKGAKDKTSKSRSKPPDAQAFDRAATNINDATAKLMRAAERHALGDVNEGAVPPDDRVRWYEEGRRAGRDEAHTHDGPPEGAAALLAAQLRPRHSADDELRRARRRAAERAHARRARSPPAPPAYDAVARAPRASRDPPPPPAAAFGAGAPLFTHFSETCGAPLTAEGADAAAARGHTVVELDRAYRSRLDALRQLLVAKLLPRRDRLAAAARWVRDRAEAFDRTFDRLDAEARRDADALLGRLRDAHQVRTGELGRVGDQLAQGVADVDRLALEASNAEADADAREHGTSKVGFVHRFAELAHEVEEVACLELPRLPDADPDACLPRELQERLAALSTQTGWKEALDVKDEMLWELADRLAQRDAALAKEKVLTEDYASEVAHWVDLAKDLREQLDAARAKAGVSGDERRRLRTLKREAELRADELGAAHAEIRDLREELLRAHADAAAGAAAADDDDA